MTPEIEGGEQRESGAVGLSIRLLGSGRCEVRHVPTGAVLTTSRPRPYGGTGDSFSSTDLLAAALGTCIASDLEGLAEHHGVSAEELVVSVEKELSTRPKRLDALHVRIRVGGDISDRTRLILTRAAEGCLVRRSLATEIRVTVVVVAGAEPVANESERSGPVTRERATPPTGKDERGP